MPCENELLATEDFQWLILVFSRVADFSQERDRRVHDWLLRRISSPTPALPEERDPEFMSQSECIESAARAADERASLASLPDEEAPGAFDQRAPEVDALTERLGASGDAEGVRVVSLMRNEHRRLYWEQIKARARVLELEEAISLPNEEAVKALATAAGSNVEVAHIVAFNLRKKGFVLNRLAIPSTVPVADEEAVEPSRRRLQAFADCNDIWQAYHDFPHPMHTMAGDLRNLLASIPSTTPVADEEAVGRAAKALYEHEPILHSTQFSGREPWSWSDIKAYFPAEAERYRERIRLVLRAGSIPFTDGLREALCRMRHAYRELDSLYGFNGEQAEHYKFAGDMLGIDPSDDEYDAALRSSPTGEMEEGR